MSLLPLEILSQIFADLTTLDLLQCQLTNKQWYEASVCLLYSKIEILSKKESFLFARTISNSSLLGSYVKTIEVTRFFEESIYNIYWNTVCDNEGSASNKYDMFNDNWTTFGDEFNDYKHDLLDALIKHCPYISEIKLSEPTPEFWTKVSYAYTQGQLLYLSNLPYPKEYSMEAYVNTALTLKKNLKSVYLYEEGFDLNLEFYTYSVFKTLYDRINEFTNIQRLDILLLSTRQLNHLDALIEDCPNLKDIHINICYTDHVPISVDAEIFANPRPDIYKLICGGLVTDNVDQLKYITQKFTNLQYLKIGLDLYIDTNHSYHPTPGVLGTFFCYVMGLPDCKVSLTIREPHFIDAWTNVANSVDIRKTIVIDNFIEYSDDIERIPMNINKESVQIFFPIYEDTRVLSHTKFLSKFGSSIRSLELRGLWNEETYRNLESSFYNAFSGLNWILKILQLCPLLQELTLYNPEDMILSNVVMVLHTKIKSLSITSLNPKSSIEFLEQLSLNLPN